MKKSGLYTRKGDDGTTSLVGGERVKKCDLRLESYGTIDELNSFVGLLMAEPLEEDTQKLLFKIQHKLFNIGSNLATNPQEREYYEASLIHPEDVQTLEHAIDLLDSSLPPMTAFVLPSGARSCALSHVCRTVCRRAERAIYRLREESPVDDTLVKYINRLSDYFFVLARYESFRQNGKEVTWSPSAL